MPSPVCMPEHKGGIYSKVSMNGMNEESIRAEPYVQRTLKRIGDVVGAIVLLIILTPVFLLISICIKLTSRGPVFFVQDRLGYLGSTFKIIKFRTMVDRAWEKGTGLYVTANDQRITGLGRMLRVLHLDELPQVLNIVRGEMSFVGPRPTVPYHYDYYEEWEKKRLDMLPGITGWAQINGGNSIDWDERIKLDVWYVRDWSLRLDFYILTMTGVHVLQRIRKKKRDGYSSDGPVWKRERPDSVKPDA